MSWDLDFNVEELAKELEGLADNSKKEFKEIPLGKYEVKCLGIEPYTSKAGKACVKYEWQIIKGEYENQRVWQYNSISNPSTSTMAFLIKLNNDFLKSMLPAGQGDESVKFQTVGQYELLLATISDIVTQKYEYVLNITEENGFRKYLIEDIFEVC